MTVSHSKRPRPLSGARGSSTKHAFDEGMGDVDGIGAPQSQTTVEVVCVRCGDDSSALVGQHQCLRVCWRIKPESSVITRWSKERWCRDWIPALRKKLSGLLAARNEGICQFLSNMSISMSILYRFVAFLSNPWKDENDQRCRNKPGRSSSECTDPPTLQSDQRIC